MSEKPSKKPVKTTAKPCDDPPKQRDSAARKAIAFSDLTDGNTECQIEHLGQIYRLRCTRNGKLILNK